jgi:hypothetical protein
LTLSNIIKHHQTSQEYTDFDAIPTPQIYNQDLAGFCTSIDTDRFLDSWRRTLHYLSSIMSTNPGEIISVKPTTGNTTRDVVKGRTCRTLNVTRKIYIRDIEAIILMSLRMTQFSIGSSVYQQIRGSPMGSPLSPALCLMVVALSEIWYRTFSDTLASMDLTSRYMWTTDYAWWILHGITNPPLPTSFTRSSTASLLSWKRNQTKNFWASPSTLNPSLSDTAPTSRL